MGKVDPIDYHENNQEFIKHDEYGNGMYSKYVFQICSSQRMGDYSQPVIDNKSVLEQLRCFQCFPYYTCPMTPALDYLLLASGSLLKQS